jgi:response regulator NasT
LSAGLIGAGCVVLCANSVNEAEKLLDNPPRPDIAIVDVVMPERSGLELVPRLRGDEIPFVMLSAYSDASIVEQATDAGALGYLIKPVDEVRLLPAIEAALACAARLDDLAKFAVNCRARSTAIGIPALLSASPWFRTRLAVMKPSINCVARRVTSAAR